MAFRLGSSSRLDERCFAMQQFKVMPLSLAMLSVYPKMYPIHDLSDEVSIAIASPPKHFEGWGTKKEAVVAMSIVSTLLTMLCQVNHLKLGKATGLQCVRGVQRGSLRTAQPRQTSSLFTSLFCFICPGLHN